MDMKENNACKKSLITNALNYLCAGLLALSVIFAFANVGGMLSGMDLMETFFRMFPHIPSNGGEGVAMWLLFFSHLGIITMGVVGTVFYALRRKGVFFSIGVTLFGFLGLISGIIAGWNVVAEVVPMILSVICVVENVVVKKT